MSSLCFFLSQPAWDGKIGTVISNAKEKKDFSNISIKFFSSVQLLSHAWLSVTPWTQHARLPCPSPTSGACSNSCPLSQWCHPTISFSFVPFSYCLQSLPVSGSFPKSVVCIRRSKNWHFSFSISPSNEYSGSISFRIAWFDLVVQRILKSLLQHHISKASILWCSAFFVVQLSHPYIATGKTIALTIQTFVGKVMSLL